MMKPVKSQTLLESLVQTNCTLRNCNFLFLYETLEVTPDQVNLYSPLSSVYLLIPGPCPLAFADFPTCKQCVTLKCDGFVKIIRPWAKRAFNPQEAVINATYFPGWPQRKKKKNIPTWKNMQVLMNEKFGIKISKYLVSVSPWTCWLR